MTEIDNCSGNYSQTWYDVFVDSIPLEQTEAEASFIARHLPQPRYTRIADLCCGTGRHVRALSEKGYQMVGIDHDSTAIEWARQQAGRNVTYYERDMRDITALSEDFDAILCLWQSFGWFDADTNRDIIDQIHSILPPNGRFVLDIYHREFFETHAGVLQFERNGVTGTDKKTIEDGRLTVSLTYDGTDTVDSFEWQLYTPDEIRDIASRAGFEYIVSSTDFDERLSPTATAPRMQFVFEKE